MNSFREIWECQAALGHKFSRAMLDRLNGKKPDKKSFSLPEHFEYKYLPPIDPEAEAEVEADKKKRLAEKTKQDPSYQRAGGILPVARQAPALLDIQNMPPDKFGAVFKTEKYDNGGVRKTITPEAMKAKLEMFKR